MTEDELYALTAEHNGVSTALADVIGSWTMPLHRVTVEPVQTIDRELLARTLVEYRRIDTTVGDNTQEVTFHYPHLYIVWGDKKLQRNRAVDFCIQGFEDDPWNNETNFCDHTEVPVVETPPIAHLFLERGDVRHLILIECKSKLLTGRRKKIEAISIQVYVPPAGMDITAAARDIMLTWYLYGPEGLDEEDYSEAIDEI